MELIFSLCNYRKAGDGKYMEINRKKARFLAALEKEVDGLLTGYENELIRLARDGKSQSSIQNDTSDTSGKEDRELDILYHVLAAEANQYQVITLRNRLKSDFPEMYKSVELKIVKELLHLYKYSEVTALLEQVSPSAQFSEEGWLLQAFEAILSIPLEHDQWDEALLDCYHVILDFISCPHPPSWSAELGGFLQDHFDQIVTLVFDINNPDLILDLCTCYVVHDLKEELMELIDHVIRNWDYLDSKMSEEQFLRLIWFAATIYKNEQLMEDVVRCLPYLQSRRLEAIAYSQLSDVSSGKSSSVSIKQCIQMVEGFELFSELEKKQINAFIHTIPWKKEGVENTLPPRQGKVVEEIRIQEISTLPAKVKLHPEGYLFHTVTIALAIYNNAEDLNADRYVNVQAKYVECDNEYFISKATLKKLRISQSNQWIILNHKNKKNQLVQRRWYQMKEQVQSQSYQESKKIEGSLELNAKSALRKLGYQITGVSREKRWEILSTKAIPTLGTRKVVELITFLIRGRKLMKNGSAKNRYAISEWEYDLSRLKRVYYKGDFPWPKGNKGDG
ncbi:hypothetical protein Q0N12_17755 [Rossellomorea marisflavi]|uniref:hypothetical protein n=1 Tax=Rossellomorea marisflavi TaxID=189381 RepID=UPI003459B0A8